MKKILTASQMKKYDDYTINEIGIPSMVLMERAALGVVDEINAYMTDTNLKPESTKVLIVCGTGNNGGDGLAVARLLLSHGVTSHVVLLGNPDKLGKECQSQRDILTKTGLPTREQMPDGEYDIIVDALFGIGLHRPLEGQFEDCIQKCNNSKGYKIAVDIPSGVCADTGKVLGVAFQADVTVTFGYLKRGLLVGEGALLSGKVLCKEIGITKKALEPTNEQVWSYDEPVLGLLPYRNPSGNKGTFGKVYIYAGSEDAVGAALLCARSAFSAGAGMVKVLCPAQHKDLFLSQFPEVMLTCYESQDGVATLKDKIEQDLQWCDVVIAGPGIGTTHMAKEILHFLINCAKVPMVLDADALNILSAWEDVRQDLLQANARTHRQVVLTPHVGELSRLLQASVTDIKAAPFEMAGIFCEMYDCIGVCKDARTIVCGKEGAMYVNLSGNHGMATAGSGDVLAGIIGAYLAVHKDANKAVWTSVYIHGLAGDEAAKEVGERALMASHIIDEMIKLQKGN